MVSTVLENLLKKHSQLEARIQSLKAKESTQKRKNDNRKKILAGAYILEKHEKAGTLQELMTELDKFLIRKNDRVLFGLVEETEKKTEEFA
ncbi:MAG TPA: hypothetical protein PLV31_06920 [Gammaproteobacteria bacterium]|nr:hypothetical protein [Gammaproteobacteria bacterium]HRA43384.1 hypothetical protein [Gammaproteobacteria bacterium]